MTAPARLLSVRLQGFKSFAERTHVAFGPGISAVVGPNGSGKSNLADALRWALGEQGRALRTRKAEDVIWAGSERRPALGMADVQLVLDNGDGLLPVEYGVVELGRRLFRSGENEYVLNRQRVRLRDLVDLLDAAHLAENAFLFIGQGMVDQALALRPEERRPLFEEVAGVRRHERRRRRAEEQLAESEANLARVEDIVVELRPQVRRLATQAEQQASRRDAGDELAAALLLAAHARWHAAAGRVARAEAALAGGRESLDAAMVTLAEREQAAASVADRLADRAAAADHARREREAASEVLTAARVTMVATATEEAAFDRDRARLEAEGAAILQGLQTDRGRAAVAGPTADPELEAELRAAEAALASATQELAAVRESNDAAEAEQAALRRADNARAAELEVARRRRTELERQVAEEAGRAADAEAVRASAAAAHDAALAERTRLAAAEASARDVEVAARERVEAAVVATARASDVAAAIRGRLAEARGRLEVIRLRLAAADGDALATAARAAGGRRVATGLVLDSGLRAAAAAALGPAGAAVILQGAAVGPLGGHRGHVVVEEALQRDMAADGADVADEAAAKLGAAVRAAGGGRLADAVRQDPSGAVRHLLAHAVWLPDLAACLAIRPLLPAGWLAAARDGEAIVGPTVVWLRPDTGLVTLQAEAEALAGEVAALEADAAAAQKAGEAAADEERDARGRHAGATAAAARATDERRAAEAAEVAAGRRAEVAAREAAWLAAQIERLRGALDRATDAVALLDGGRQAPAPAGAGRATQADEALQHRVDELRARRDRLAAGWQAAEASRRAGERERAAADAGIALGERRLAEVEASVADLEARAASLARRRAEAAAALATAQATADAAASRLDALLALDADDRASLGGAERAAVAAREALRAVQDAAGSAEREELEARLGLDGLREQLLVELAGLGDVGLRQLGAPAPVTEEADDSTEVRRLEDALAAAAERWAGTAPPAEAPTPGRLGALRRRFHELGPANPYALEEHAALAARLESLETQRRDLLGAVERTRALIAELDGLIASQFRATFGALERAFDARFRQLFGGGFARLTLTEPGDLAATGIEITARPPGKKPQALAMLSGGERALTAVALLFAMLEIRPVPFCVLDEVDAALDEANIGRFTEALRDLAGRTQFVVITHNRGTIEIADALYGVTVGDDSVSRVISLRLEDATAIADAAAAGRRRAPIIPAGLTDPAAVAEAAG